MQDTGIPTEYSAHLDATGMRFAIVVSRYNSFVTKELLAGAMDAIVRHGGSAEAQEVIWAPGGFEIPMVVQMVLKRGGVDGVIALGCVMTGETTHNEYIAGEVTKGCAQLALEFGKPVSFGVLTPNTVEQALNRAGLKMGNKGAEAALAAIELVGLGRLLGKR
jgi:6,7-dimethyl-8-ribityllumazine synthase